MALDSLARRAAAVAAVAAVLASPASAQAPASRIARAAFPADALTQVQTDAQTGVPTFLAGRLGAASSAAPSDVATAFIRANAALFGLGAHDAVAVRETTRDALGMAHVRVQQTVDGVPVFGGDAVVHLDPTGAVVAYSGGLRAEASEVQTTPALSPNAALAAARADVRAEAERPADDLAAWTPEARLAVYPAEAGLVLAYVVRIYQDAPFPANWAVVVDAQTGRVVERWNAIDTAAPPLAPVALDLAAAFPAADGALAWMTPATGTGISRYNGTVSIGTDRVSSTSYRLYDTSRGNGIRTRDAATRTTLPGTDITDSDNAFTSTTTRSAIDAHWGAEQVYDYYLGTHGRNSFDGNGAAINSSVRYSRSYNNAFWNGTQMVYGEGDGSQFTPLVELDICAHELTHAVTERTAGLVYNREPGALNESLSDIFAVMVDRDDWMIGDKSYTPGTAGDALRYMDTPTRGGQPDTYANRAYAGSCSPTSSNDYCGVHTNSGIPNHAAYLMAAGGTKGGVTVASIGRSDAERVWYRALTTYFTSTTDFAGARAGTIQAAVDLFGAGSSKVAAVTNAWAAVGVGAGSTGGGGGTTPPAAAQWYYETQTLQSPHNYPNNYNASTTYTKAGAQRVAMYFEQFTTEANYDYVYIRDGAGAQTAAYTGNKAAFWAIVDGATIRANLVSDYSVTAYGYRVTQVAYFAPAPLFAGGTPMGIAPLAAPSDALAGIAGGAQAAKTETALLPTRPNPSRGEAVVAFSLAEAGAARVAVVDVLGREVAVLAQGTAEAGTHEATVQGLAPGTYLVVLETGGARTTSRLTVVR